MVIKVQTIHTCNKTGMKNILVKTYLYITIADVQTQLEIEINSRYEFAT